MNVSFTINNDAFKESETQKISNVYLVIEYDNPQGRREIFWRILL